MADSIMWLYLILGIVAGIIMLSGITMMILNKRHKTRRSYSLPVSGSDSTDISERLAERFRNERAKED